MLAIDDGLASGNLNAADIFFFVAMIVALIAAGLAASRNAVHVRWSPTVGWLAVAIIAFAWFLL